MKIYQPRFVIFFLVMLIVPGMISYIGGWDTKLDRLFVLKAFSIACFMTVLYYLLLKNGLGRSK
ncbi:hypothetical protein [Daejeonella sp. JGW-45]|uniref:hypothetical protein n=1 Tax=Daejeonella sp. JGW-45 TaxID=3034148 RepID=UPI0023ECBE55|nr:hypothetical protein [Daejeonella sp. JGW-45]